MQIPEEYIKQLRKYIQCTGRGGSNIIKEAGFREARHNNPSFDFMLSVFNKCINEGFHKFKCVKDQSVTSELDCSDVYNSEQGGNDACLERFKGNFTCFGENSTTPPSVAQTTAPLKSFGENSTTPPSVAQTTAPLKISDPFVTEILLCCITLLLITVVVYCFKYFKGKNASEHRDTQPNPTLQINDSGETALLSQERGSHNI